MRSCFWLVFLSTCWLVKASTYPGTETRPILSDEEASKYTKNNYFSGWEPDEIDIPNNPDYVVSEGESIQAVVNEAIRNGKSDVRTYIRIDPGHYMQTVYVTGEIPLTIYGGGSVPGDVHIMATLSATTTPEEYQNIVNEDGSRYKEGDPAWELYRQCAEKEDIIDTECTAVFWVASADFQLQGVEIHNGAIEAQAVALKTAADRLHIMNSHFKGMQDTVGFGIDNIIQNTVERVYVHMCYIEGEVDYVFGSASVVFDMVTFNTTTTADKSTLVVFAPDTPSKRLGFLVLNSIITGDDSYIGSNKVKLGRAWDRQVASADQYIPGESPNGQLVIRDTEIDNVIDVESPYSSAATSKRPFTTDISVDRDLDDDNHNRMWEYNNSGSGAQ